MIVKLKRALQDCSMRRKQKSFPSDGSSSRRSNNHNHSRQAPPHNTMHNSDVQYLKLMLLAIVCLLINWVTISRLDLFSVIPSLRQDSAFISSLGAKVTRVVRLAQENPLLKPRRNNRVPKDHEGGGSSEAASLLWEESEDDEEGRNILEDCRKQAEAGWKGTVKEREAYFKATPCGALWYGSTLNPGTFNDEPRTVHIVVAYCSYPLNWLVPFFGNLLERQHHLNMTVYSKCGKEDRIGTYLQGIKVPYQIETLPNHGGNDHTYSHFAARYHLTERADYVLFMKDTELSGKILKWASYRRPEEMLRIASVKGFGCGLQTDIHFYLRIVDKGSKVNALFSTYHNVHAVTRYQMKSQYKRQGEKLGVIEANNTDDGVPFASKWSKMRNWMVEYLKYYFPMPEKATDVPIVPVCYCGYFAVSRERLLQHPQDLYGRIETSLSRGNNIEEGHYAERMWAGLWSIPLSFHEREAILAFTGGMVKRRGGVYGSLARDALT